jgi:SAM-dependent methyltransferase
MTTATIHALNRLNQQFYAQQAQTFAATRQYPWPSWERFGTKFSEQHQPLSSPLHILDVGCGQGRLATFWSDRQQQSPAEKFAYWGLDQSAPLLAFARSQHPQQHWLEADIVESLLNDRPLLSVPGQDFHNYFHVIALFGLFHHIPSQNLREKLLVKMLPWLVADGEIWLSLWSPLRLGATAPATLSRTEVVKKYRIDQADLEDNDVFIGWQHSSDVRYVHWLSEAEETALIAASGCQVLERWESQILGERGNIYYRLCRP